MLFERVLPFLLAATLLAAPLLELPKQHSLVSGLNEPRNSFSSESLQSSDDGKHALRGTVVNSVTGEPTRGALVQIYFNGQSSMLTGPDGKFQFEGLPNGQTVVVCATTFGLEGAVGSDVTAHLPSVHCGIWLAHSRPCRCRSCRRWTYRRTERRRNFLRSGVRGSVPSFPGFEDQPRNRGDDYECAYDP